MFKTAAAICSLLPSLALAQYNYGPPAGNTSPTTSAAAAAAVPSAPANTDGHINVSNVWHAAIHPELIIKHLHPGRRSSRRTIRLQPGKHHSAQ